MVSAVIHCKTHPLDGKLVPNYGFVTYRTQMQRDTALNSGVRYNKCIIISLVLIHILPFLYPSIVSSVPSLQTATFFANLSFIFQPINFGNSTLNVQAKDVKRPMQKVTTGHSSFNAPAPFNQLPSVLQTKPASAFGLQSLVNNSKNVRTPSNSNGATPCFQVTKAIFQDRLINE